MYLFLVACETQDSGVELLRETEGERERERERERGRGRGRGKRGGEEEQARRSGKVGESVKGGRKEEQKP